MNNNFKPQHEKYTWHDIFGDRKAIGNFIIITFLINCVVVLITHFYFLFTPDCNAEAIVMMMFAYTTPTSLLISAVLAVVVIRLFKNSVLEWLTKTKTGNILLSVLTLVSGIITMGVMCGINYLWMPEEEIAESLWEDAYAGMLIPFDISTIIFTLITYWFWKTARKCVSCNKEWIHTGFILAIISLIISFTPLQFPIQCMLLGLIRGTDVLNM